MEKKEFDLFGIQSTLKKASTQGRGMRFLAVYLGLAFIISFLFVFSLAPQVGEKLGKLSANKQSQESKAGYINPQGPCLPFGDVNYNKLVNATDAQQILQVVAGKIQFKSDPKYADVDADGSITSKDALLIQRYIAGLADTFPVCPKPAPPQGLSATTKCDATGNPQITFGWTDTSSEQSYLLEISNSTYSPSDPSPSSALLGTKQLSANTTSYIWSKYTPMTSGNPLVPANGAKYYWKVRSLVDNTYYFSSQQTVTSADCLQYPQ